MTAPLNALKSAKEKTAIIVALFSVLAAFHPATMTAQAQTLGPDKSLVLEIKNQTLSTILNSENKNSQKFANIDKKVAAVRNYLQSKNSPLADYTEIILAQDDWKTILAISNAESTLGQRCYRNNCSGIYCNFDTYGRDYSGLCAYETKADWIVALQNLIDQRYKGWTLKQMNGIYVYPRSSSWYIATTQVYSDLTKIEQQLDQKQA